MTIDRDELRRRIEEHWFLEDRPDGTAAVDLIPGREADLRVWERHRPEWLAAIGGGELPYCKHDSERWPCPDFVDLAARYGLTP